MDLGIVQWRYFLRMYSQKLRHLDIDSALSQTSVIHLQHLRAETATSLCHRLVSIRVSRTSGDVNAFSQWSDTMALLIDPHIATVEIAFTSSYDNVMTNHLAGLAPSTRLLVIHPRFDICIGAFSAIKQLHCDGPLYLSTWASVASCTTLESVWIGFLTGEKVGEPLPGTFSLPNLHTLSIHDSYSSQQYGSSTLARLIQSTIMPSLRIAKLGIWNGQHVAAVKRHLRQHSPNLEELYIRTDCSKLFGCLTEALDLRSAREVIVGGGCIAIRVGQDDPGFVSRARDACHPWPQNVLLPIINLLRLAPEDPTASSLIFLEISLSDGRGRPPIKSHRLSSLRRLTIRRLKLQDISVKPFAEWLATLCPNLQELGVLERGVLGQQSDVKQERRELMNTFWDYHRALSNGT